MKRWITGALALAMIVMLSGCGMGKLLQDFSADNPDATIVPIDDDGDGVPEAYGADLDGDKVSDKEIPGSRERLAEAGFLDENVELLLLTIGGLGIPGVGLAGKWWGKLRPTKRAIHWQTMFGGVVKSVQAVRESKEITPETLATANQVLQSVQKDIQGLEAAILHFKADEKG